MSYRLEKGLDGKFHFTCVVPSSAGPQRQHQFDASAPNEEEAIHQALAQAERWLHGQ
jgi:hypothetical protein